jgi:hypothetical protein
MAAGSIRREGFGAFASWCVYDYGLSPGRACPCHHAPSAGAALNQRPFAASSKPSYTVKRAIVVYSIYLPSTKVEWLETWRPGVLKMMALVITATPSRINSWARLRSVLKLRWLSAD